MLDVRLQGLDGAKLETVLEHALIICNKNTCPGDKSALRPGGVRLGSPYLTTRGFDDDDFRFVAGLIVRALRLAKSVNERNGTVCKTLKEFKERLASDEEYKTDIADLKKDVTEFAQKFPLPGLEKI